MTIRAFAKHHYRYFNAATLVDAAEAWMALLDTGGKMFLTMAGAMSTAELGLSLAEMIRRDKVHAISCTGANLEEDVFNLVAHDHYVRDDLWGARLTKRSTIEAVACVNRRSIEVARMSSKDDLAALGVARPFG
jgi:deoxyhypusine synthase